MRRKLIAVFFCSFALTVSPAIAQQAPSSSGMNSGTGEISDSGVHSEEAIPIGPFIFSPALQLAWQDRDNIFFTPDNEIADQLILAKAQLLFEVPVYESYLRFSYTPQYRDYKDLRARRQVAALLRCGGGLRVFERPHPEPGLQLHHRQPRDPRDRPWRRGVLW